MNHFLKNLDAKSKVGLFIGFIVIIGVTVFFGFKVLMPNYQVLFNGLSNQDTASIIEELDKLKIPYRLAGDGSTVLVDESSVLQTRMKLMGKDIPLKGAVGFELFNQSDFGMTEFAQRVNYQRALQGELTRTIKSLSQVRDVKVLLVLPEKSLFKQASNKAKASITVLMHPGQSLRPEQVLGIQRLVCASVPGMHREDVMVLDQQGIALSRESDPADGQQIGSGRLDLKKETENYLAAKATHMLENMFGEGQAAATVDVLLNQDKSQVTIEDLITPPGRVGQTHTGVVIKERETVAANGGSAEQRSPEGTPQRVERSTREIEYSVGRRLEQVMTQPGSIRRLQAVAIIKRNVSTDEIEQAKKVLAASIGALIERGDVVVVQTQLAFKSEKAIDAALTPTPSTLRPSELPVSPSKDAGEPMPIASTIAGVLLLVVALLLVGRLVYQRQTPLHPPTPAILTPQQRSMTLAQIKTWLAEGQEKKSS